MHCCLIFASRVCAYPVFTQFHTQILSVYSNLNSSKKDDVINELKNKFKLAEGQLRAVNNNPLVVKELKDILKKLTLYNVVSLKNSKDYLKQF